MPRKPNPPPDDKEQMARFMETAKAMGADKTGKVFEGALKIITPIKKSRTKKT